ncbi:MAG: Putative baseplate assembly protein [Nitrospira sp.]|nr:MAG: Putative baseplate assembly protein [Nitrospira sp.]
MTYFCCDELRRQVVRNHPTLNGIDFLEVIDHTAPTEAERQRKLELHFVKPLGALALAAGNISIEGGERITTFHVLSVVAGSGSSADVLTVEVDQPGDFSTYTLRLVTDALNDTVPHGVDPQLAAIEFSFKVECPSPFDCAPQHRCPEVPASAPVIDYLAKDYASFRRVMLDRMSALMPQWKERSPADLGVMLVEALAYTADQLSYQQDAVATEAYLGTARRRVSVRRHARLMDYYVSEGCNARTWVHIQVAADVVRINPAHPAIPVGTKLTTRIPGQLTPIADDPRVYEQADLLFETMEPLQSLYADHNELRFYSWSDQRCCLPKGSFTATLAGHHPNLASGMLLLFEEVIGPKTGSPADADPSRRHVVRLDRVVVTATGGGPLTDPVTNELITDITWCQDDALPFPLCLSAATNAGYRDAVTVAHGNLVLADHGVTLADESLGSVPEPFLFMPRSKEADRCDVFTREPVPPRFRPSLSTGPLTHAGPAYDHANSARSALQWDLRAVQPSITLTGKKGTETTMWTVRRDLLNSGADADEYVVEVDNDGSGIIRFGDDVHGRRPESGTAFTAQYRIGNGRAGNIGADSLVHVALALPEITLVRNPLPAVGGQEPESLQDVRQRAPVAYRVQERAVTEADYAEVTERRADVQRAAAAFRWTGCWHTVFVTVDREGGAGLSEEFETDIRAHVERYRMAGHDLEIDGPQLVSLEIDLHVCVGLDHFRSDVERELLDGLSNRDLPDGRRGLFHPDLWTFGQPVYLSAIYGAAHRVIGVESVEVRTFQRQGVPESNGLDSARLDMAALEIPRLDNDRNFPEHGRLTITLGGGK